MSITLAMQSAVSGLKTSQSAVDLASMNISNVNTQGYSKKVFQQESVIIDGRGGGVQVGKYTRNIDESMLKSMRTESSTLHKLDVLDEYYSRIVETFGEPGSNNSLAHSFTELQEAIEAFSVDSDVTTTQNNVVAEAVDAIDKISALSNEVQALRLEADISLEEAADEINELLINLDELNDEVVRIDNLGVDSAEDLKDKRDQALTRLSELVDISYYTRSSGEVVVLTKDGVNLLDKEPAEVNHVRVSQTSAWTSYSGGEIGGFYAGDVDITKQVRSGALKGYMDMRDNLLPQLQAQLDELSYQLKENMNLIHNRGTNYPNTPSHLTGSKTFIDYDTNSGVDDAQSISISNGDVRVAIFDNDGAEVATTTLGNLGFTSGLIHDDSGFTPGTLTETIQTWLNDPNGANIPTATVGIDTQGRLDIDLGTSEYGIGFRDEASNTPGAEQQDVTVSFDANGDGTTDEDYTGFSNFFGLNNFFEETRKGWIYDSEIRAKDFNPNLSSPATISFSDETNGMNFETVTIYQNDSLKDIVERINDNPDLEGIVNAELVAEGSGVRVRIRNELGEQMEITEVPGTNLLQSLGLSKSNSGLSTGLKVKQEIQDFPANLNGGAVQYDANSGEYFLSAADNTTANKMAEFFATPISFKNAGNLSKSSYSIVEYATSIISDTSAKADNNNDRLLYQQDLTNSLETKVAAESGVNLDEELSELMIFQQSYNAAAKVISTCSQMMDILNQMI